MGVSSVAVATWTLSIVLGMRLVGSGTVSVVTDVPSVMAGVEVSAVAASARGVTVAIAISEFVAVTVRFALAMTILLTAETCDPTYVCQ